MELAEIFGSLAAILTTIAYVPQALKTIKSKKAEDVSIIMYIVMFTGVLCWLIYGVFLKSLPMMFGNSVTLSFILIIIIMKIHYK